MNNRGNDMWYEPSVGSSGYPGQFDPAGFDWRNNYGEAATVKRVVDAQSERARADVESKLRRVLNTTFDLTHSTTDSASATAKARNEYVDKCINELVGKPLKAWTKQLEQSQAAQLKIEQQLVVLKVEHASRLQNEFWATLSSTEQRARIRDHFRQQADHASLYKSLQAEAQAYVQRWSAPFSMPDLQAAIEKLSKHAGSKAGEACPSCAKGHLVTRSRAFDGGRFLGCDRFPDCRHAWSVELGTTMDLVQLQKQADTRPAADASVSTMLDKAVDDLLAQPAPVPDVLWELARELSTYFTKAEGSVMCVELGMCKLDPIERVHHEGVTEDVEVWASMLLAAIEADLLVDLAAVLRGQLRLRWSETKAIEIDRRWRPLWEQLKQRTTACTQTADVVTTDVKETVKDMADAKTHTGTGMTIGGAASLLFEMTKEDAGDAVWRTSADRAVDLLKEPTKIALRKIRTQPLASGAKFMLTAIDHPVGEGVFSWCAGVTLVGYGPLRGKSLGPKTARLAKELRVKGIKPFTDLVSKSILDPVRKAIVALVESLPDEASLEV